MLGLGTQGGVGLEAPAGAHRLPCICTRKAGHEAILVLSGEPLSIEFPTPLSLKDSIAWLSPKGIIGSGQMVAYCQSAKAGGKRRHVLQSGEPAALADVCSQLEPSTLR